MKSAQMDYETSCASCHGKSGKGDGPVAAELRTRPPDLTILARKNDGVFPGEVLYQIIDGRKTIRAHGTYEMPVWGFVFQSASGDEAIKSRIFGIIDYLKSMQIK
jgi:mono/diheme cytochrome c family protein